MKIGEVLKDVTDRELLMGILGYSNTMRVWVSRGALVRIVAEHIDECCDPDLKGCRDSHRHTGVLKELERFETSGGLESSSVRGGPNDNKFLLHAGTRATFQDIIEGRVYSYRKLTRKQRGKLRELARYLK